MTYLDTDLLFVTNGGSAGTASRSLGKQAMEKNLHSVLPEVLGIRLRLGDRPLVYNLNALAQLSGKTNNATPAVEQDYYLVIHTISAIRTQGRARVEELQYFATALAPDGLQTVDLVPKTRFNQVVNAGLYLEGALDLFGEVSADVPSALIDQLLDKHLDLGPRLRLQFSASTRFIGKFTYSLQVPVVQASGVGSATCSWLLRPNEEKVPLLGDQLLVQSIAVPKGTKSINYTISGLVKADRGLFWKQQQLSTPNYTIDVLLDPLN